MAKIRNLNKSSYIVLGVMSGTSLDGLDIAVVKFDFINDVFQYEFIDCTTFTYPQLIMAKLAQAQDMNAYNFVLFNNQYGEFIGKCINEFIDKKELKIDFIASHGHTIFHQPEKKLTMQIGNGAHICATTKLTTISDFRTLDVALKGQGAPLVPIGDLHLFEDYKYCLNLGGFMNNSVKENKQILAYDLGPCNFALNYLSRKLNLEFDRDGLIAKSGKIDKDLLQKLNALSYYSVNPPKSLGREWFEDEFKPILDSSNSKTENQLRTVCEHIAFQISKNLDNSKESKLLITGGGAYNNFLIDLLREKTNCQILVPEKELVEYKEALIFAYLGLLRFLNKTNVLKSVTGSVRDNIGGIIHYQ